MFRKEGTSNHILPLRLTLRSKNQNITVEVSLGENKHQQLICVLRVAW
jgi:hypothetical protein